MKPIYLIQEHHALKAGLHYDLRLQVNSVLFSWAIPKGMPEQYGVKRLAIRTEDHALSWAKFEGIIPEGQYGAGKVNIWDKGWYLPLEIKKNKLTIEIHGKRLKGIWTLSQKWDEENKWFIHRVEED